MQLKADKWLSGQCAVLKSMVVVLLGNQDVGVWVQYHVSRLEIPTLHLLLKSLEVSDRKALQWKTCLADVNDRKKELCALKMSVVLKESPKVSTRHAHIRLVKRSFRS